MSGPPLLQIRTTFVAVDIYGPCQSRMGAVFGEDSEHGRIFFKGESDGLEVWWRDSQGTFLPWSPGDRGPCFFEETTYRIRVKSLSGKHVPVILHRDPNLLNDIDTYIEDKMCAGPVNFMRQVGQSTIEIRVGNKSLFLTIEVFPVKLDYGQDYKALLSDVASAARGLALEYLRATYQTGSGRETDHITDLEWLTLLRNELDVLERAIRYINDHPHRLLSRQPEYMRLEKAKRTDSSIRQAISRGRGIGPMVEVPGVGRVRGVLPAIQSKETLQIPEHKWIRLNLCIISNHLADLHGSVVEEIGKYETSNRATPKRLKAEEAELSQYVRRIEGLLSLPVFNGVHGVPPPGFASLTLLGGIGYSEAYSAITVLRLGLDVQGEFFDYSSKDVHDLYEVWCFIQLVRHAASAISGRANSIGLIKLKESGIRVRLQRGEQSAISLKCRDSNRYVIISYNPAFPGLTGDQKPDIVLRIQQPGWPDLIVVFDAKYRLDASEAYLRRFGTVGPPQDAINAIHRYRDAIVVDSADRGLERPVVKGAALFPLPCSEIESFKSSSIYLALDKLGIGALPFLPSNTLLVEDWLRSLLALNPEELAEPGPRFSGLEEIYRQRLEA